MKKESHSQSELKQRFFSILSERETVFDAVQQHAQAGLAFWLWEGKWGSPWINHSLNTLLSSTQGHGYESDLLELLPQGLSLSEGPPFQKVGDGFLQLSPKNGRRDKAFDYTAFQITHAESHYLLCLYREHQPSNKLSRRYEHLLDSFNQHAFYFVRTDLEGKYTYVNDFFCQKLGISREETIGQFGLAHIIPEDHQKCRDVIQRCFQYPEKPQRVILRKPDPRGGTLTNDWQFTLTIDDKGNPEEFICIGHDISIQLEQARELRLLQTIAQRIHNGILVTDSELNIQWANHAFQQLTGYTQRVIRQEAFLVDFFGKEITDLSEQASQNNASINQRIFTCFNKEKEIIWLSTEIFPLYNEHNKRNSFVLVCADISELIQTEQSLMESQEMLENIANSIPGLIMRYLVDPNGKEKVQFVSKGAQELWGLSPEEVMEDASRVWSRIHPDDVPRMTQSLAAATNSLSIWKEDYRLQLDKQNTRWISARGIPRKLSSGSILWHTLALDITERKQAEISLASSQERYKNVVNSVPGAIFQFERQQGQSSMGFTFVSNGIKQLVTGLTPEQLIEDYTTVFGLLHSDDMESVRKATVRAYLKHSPLDIEYRINDPSGKVRWQRALAKPEELSDGRTVWYGTFQDITERVHASQQWEKLAYIAEHSSDMLLTCDQNGYITWSNEVHEKIIGHTPREILGKKIIDSVEYPESEEEKFKKLLQAIRDQEHYNQVMQVFRKDGSICWIQYNATPIFGKKNQFLYFIITKSEVTELIHNQKKTQELLDTTMSQNSRLKEYSYITSHNIRSSVSRILGLIELLSLSPDSKEYFEMLRESAQKLDLTINNINDLLQLEKDFQRAEQDEYNLSEALSRIIELNRSLIQDSNADIKLSMLPDIRIKTIPAYADSIMQNLITNAMKYGVTPLSKQIEIELGLEDGYPRFTVKDYGVGIDLEKLGGRLFKLGSRLHNISKGHGLGLFMVKQQVEAINGTIGVSSEPYKGSVFTVKFGAKVIKSATSETA